MANCSALHKDHDENEGIHQIHNWEFANSTARLNYPYVAADVGKVARQDDDGYFYLLIDESGPEFLTLGIGGSGSPPAASLRGTESGVLLVSGLSVTSYGTITAAMATASSGDAVHVGPGTYVESFTVPTGVALKGSTAGTVLISGTITLSAQCYLEAVSVLVPSGGTGVDISAAGAGSSLVGVYFLGVGTGTAVKVSGSGAGVAFRCICISCNVTDIFEIDSGSLIVSNCAVQSGTIVNVIQNNGGNLQVNALSVESTANVSVGLDVQAASTNLLGTFILNGVSTGINLNADDATIEMLGSSFKDCTTDILVQAGISSGIFQVIGCQLEEEKFNIASSFANNPDFLMSFQDETVGDPSIRNWSELHVGHAERGFESVFGEGDSYVRGMTVLTTDSTASAVSDGGNFTDVTVAARSLSASTFTFQGTAANHTILACSTLENTDGLLKHWGWKIAQTTAMVGGSMAFEIWDGSQWSEIGIMATDSGKFYRYADQAFLRTNNSEHIRFGIVDSSDWETKTINGTDGYWARVRISSAVSTAPVFEQFKLSTSRSELNEQGTFTTHGLGRFKIDVANSGNVFGESGGVATGVIGVGSGGVPNGWNHQIKNSILNNNGDAIYFQFNLPKGIDTSFPLEVDLSYIPVTAGSGTASFIVSLLPQAMVGVLVADPTGGEVPVPRIVANTDVVTANAAQTDTQALNNSDTTRVRKADFGGFDVSSHYEGDLVFGRVEMDSSAGGGEIAIVSVSVRGVTWTLGERLV